ncbi:polyprenol monophosphomannose synthase [Microbacterium yannicii]|uniref:Polyprenol monophosphomannose synthase n=1 Tax=Microbacterium yannicii TaxID=671622 RepID=A0ABP9MJK2_9MICO|nr:polyprenol monophosphomannose synthase [Microbacterium yannicii]MCO5953261.1 polyprenol monophosphomannose synthase [Microbacterium yannicii]
MTTLAILPTYNELESLEGVVRRFRRSVPDVEVLIVDDDSPDGTGRLADRLADDRPNVHVIHRAVRTGLGGAYLEGFAWALREGFDVIVECDADGSHRPEELPRLLAAIETSDVVVGSRWTAGGAVEKNWPLSRRLLSRGGSAYARLMLRIRQKDATGGYRAYRAAALRALELESVSSQGYCFQIELLWRANRSGLRITEVPITFSDRTLGVSKMRGRIVAEAMWRVTRWGLATVLDPGSSPVLVNHA